MAVFATFTPQCRWIFVQITTAKSKQTGKNRPEWDTNRADQTTGPFQNKTSSYLPLWRPQGSRGGCARHPRTPPHPVSCLGNVCVRAYCRWKPKRLLKSWESNCDLIQTHTLTLSTDLEPAALNTSTMKTSTLLLLVALVHCECFFFFF